jgi:signal transduction histidine kinase
VDIIGQNCDQLEALLSNILTFSQYQAGALRASPILFNVRDSVASIIRRITPLAQEKGIELSLTAPEDLPFINTTHHHFVRILENIVSNAVRYTETGSITISIFMEPGHNMVISVRDTGPGIPEELILTIQQEYGQAPSSVGKGVGLGLHIVSALIAINSGKLRISSNIGEGSTFSVVFPVQKCIEQEN